MQIRNSEREREGGGERERERVCVCERGDIAYMVLDVLVVSSFLYPR